MSSPNTWLFSDNSRYSTRARLLFMGLSFAIGILTFLLYLALWYACSRRGRRSSGGAVEAPASAADRGMSVDAIAALPTFAHEGAEALDCAVCLGQVEPGEKVRRLPKCTHSFHAECVDAWLRAHSTCPMCRAAVGPAASATAKKTETITSVPVPATATATATAAAAAEALLPV
ncbi:RING-H2 finger protein ATL39-like [Phragmites australis]|uniref:RING-H2 finger protein ATL39-like n=1 Tax=Phragmites australis TaxID=29695 RepID=UPI002D79114F|nr:RING-H2 finger protein ATL39-like [Phragmites australis]